MQASNLTYGFCQFVHFVVCLMDLCNPLKLGQADDECAFVLVAIKTPISSNKTTELCLKNGPRKAMTYNDPYLLIRCL